jgi:hypothetical protein
MEMDGRLTIEVVELAHDERLAGTHANSSRAQRPLFNSRWRIPDS